MGSKDNLVPRQIVNAKGHHTTVYVKPDQGGGASSDQLKSMGVGAPSIATSVSVNNSFEFGELTAQSLSGVPRNKWIDPESEMSDEYELSDDEVDELYGIAERPTVSGDAVVHQEGDGITFKLTDDLYANVGGDKGIRYVSLHDTKEEALSFAEYRSTSIPSSLISNEDRAKLSPEQIQKLGNSVEDMNDFDKMNEASGYVGNARVDEQNTLHYFEDTDDGLESRRYDVSVKPDGESSRTRTL